jgi:hypothetical protein
MSDAVAGGGFSHDQGLCKSVPHRKNRPHPTTIRLAHSLQNTVTGFINATDSQTAGLDTMEK